MARLPNKRKKSEPGGKSARGTVDWVKARAEFEREPLATFASVGAAVGVSKQRVAAKAKEEGWRKKADMTEIAAAAQRQADARYVPPAPGEQMGHATPRPTDPAGRAEIAAEQKAVDMRADVTLRHRMPWPAMGAKLLNAVQQKDWPAVKGLKTGAEALLVIQTGERKAWGMVDAGGESTPGSTVAGTMRVIVEREVVPVAK